MVDENRQFHPSSLWGLGSHCWAWLKQSLIHWSLIDRCLLRPAVERRRWIYHFGETAVVTYCYHKNMCHKDMYACLYVRTRVFHPADNSSIHKWQPGIIITDLLFDHTAKKHHYHFSNVVLQLMLSHKVRQTHRQWWTQTHIDMCTHTHTHTWLTNIKILT